jgi:hypothetical protein
MHYFEGERLENEQIKRSLQKIGFRFGPDLSPDILEERYLFSCRRSREASHYPDPLVFAPVGKSD